MTGGTDRSDGRRSDEDIKADIVDLAKQAAAGWKPVTAVDRLAVDALDLLADLEAANQRANRADRYAAEMERQRNAFGEALARLANGESAIATAAAAMVELSDSGPS